MDSIDYTNEPCKECGFGKYQETSIHDDWDGTLHCTKCGHEVYRYGEAQHYRSKLRQIEYDIEFETKQLKTAIETTRDKLSNARKSRKFYLSLLRNAKD